MWYWWFMLLPPGKPPCQRAHDSVERASQEFDKGRQEAEASIQKDRHGARNIRFLMEALGRKLEKANEPNSK